MVSFKAVRGCEVFNSSKAAADSCSSSTSVSAIAESRCSPWAKSEKPPSVSPATTSPRGAPPSRGTRCSVPLAMNQSESEGSPARKA